MHLDIALVSIALWKSALTTYSVVFIRKYVLDVIKVHCWLQYLVFVLFFGQV